MAGAPLVSPPLARPRTRAFALALTLLVLPGLGCLPPVSGPLTVWAVDERAWLTADTSPVLESEVFSASRRQIKLTAAVNETVGFQLGLSTETPPAGPYQLDFSDLVGPARLSSKATISLYRIRPVRVDRFSSWYPQHTGRSATPASFPDILVPWEAPQGGGPLRLAGAGNELLWVDLRVPPTTDPGVYTGRLTVRRVSGTSSNPNSTAESPSVFACDVRLRVLPVALPSTRTLPVICRVDPRDLLARHLGWPREPAEQTRLLPHIAQHQAAVRLIGATMQLLHEHRTTPVLWASFPNFRPVGPRRVEVDWEPYDRLVEGWISGEGFNDLVPLTHWPVPVSLDYPNARQEGGLTSPGYARLLAAYLAECQRHFEQRGWLDRAFVRLCPPENLTADAVERVRRVGGILRQSETRLPLMAHLPARSLRGLGWRNAPVIELPDVSIWAPPAMWYEPEPMRQARALGRRTWLMPDQPPYSGTLAPEGLPTDATTLPWLAYRYGVDALWIEHAAEFGADTCLIYPGTPYGLRDRPIPSIRLKRLRRGLQDHALLSLLERRGKRLLADSLTQQVVRWACTDACIDHLLNCKPAGWSREVRTLVLARGLALQELADEFTPAAGPKGAQLARLAEWGVLLNEAARLHVATEGVRLSAVGDDLRANVICTAMNTTNRTLSGRWVLPDPPVGWSQPAQPVATLPPNTRRVTPLELHLTGLAYNIDGVYPFTVHFETAGLGTFAVQTRLAIAACPFIEHPPTIDGNLSDWPLASNNAAGDFRLVRGGGATLTSMSAARPTLPTRAFFCVDRERLYVAVRCRLAEGEQPFWRADNRVPLDGAVPWGQDVVEVLIHPRPSFAGTSGDIYALQIKPNGVLVARRGCVTDPPIGKSEVWQSGAAVAVRVQPDAWIVELSLPLTALGRSAIGHRTWGLNITRLDARRGEYSSWSGARGYCYSPQSLGNLILLRP